MQGSECDDVREMVQTTLACLLPGHCTLCLCETNESNRGYKDSEQETAKAITPDGWLRTGDLGYLDENGYLYIYDRVKDLIKYKG